MSLYKKLEEYSKSNVYGFHMPGHKRNMNMEIDPYQIDITEIHDMDDLHDPDGIILQEMEKGAALYKSDSCYLLVNGSTVGNLAAIYSVLSKEDTVLIERSCHKSVYNGAIVTGCKVEYLYSQNEEGIYRGVTVESVKDALTAYNNIKAIVITSPTYEGYVSPIKEIAGLAHEKGIVLIVDAAHGAHLGFNDYFPPSPVEEDADIVIMSLHKTLPALTQTAVMHVKGNLVDREKLEEALDIFETSSPSYVLMSSISKAFEEIEKPDAFNEYVSNLKDFYAKVRELKNLKIIGMDDVNKDPSKIIISTKNASISGPELADICREKYELEFEMSSFDYVLAMTSIADTSEGFDRLASALMLIDETLEQIDKTTTEIKIDIKPEKKLEISEARRKEYKFVSLDEALGKIAFSEICIYPPGSPIIVPGELVDENVINLIKGAKDAKLHVTGLKDGCIKIIRE